MNTGEASGGAAATPDHELPQLDGSCDVCEPDEARPATEVCHACSFAFCPGHALEHRQRTRHSLTPYDHRTPRGSAPVGEGSGPAAPPQPTAPEAGVAGLGLKEEEEKKKKKEEEKKEEEKKEEGKALRAQNTGKQMEILGMLTAAVRMAVGGQRQEQATGGLADDEKRGGGGERAEGSSAKAQQQHEGAVAVPPPPAPPPPAPAPEPRVCDTVTVARLRCTLHGQEGTIYCRTDEKIVCVLCALQGEHRGHDIITLHEAYHWQKNREGPDLLGQTKEMGERIMSKWTDPALSPEELQAYVDAQFDELKRLVHLQERRNRHLVDLKEAFLTATAAEKIAEITLETERLEEQMSHISYDLAVLNRAKMEPGPTAAVIKLLEGGPRARLRKPDGQLFDMEARPRDMEARPRLPEPRHDRDDDAPGSSMAHAP